MSSSERLTRQYERVTAMRNEEFMAQRMELLNGAINWITQAVSEDYDVSIHEVVLVAEFLSGETRAA